MVNSTQIHKLIMFLYEIYNKCENAAAAVTAAATAAAVTAAATAAAEIRGGREGGSGAAYN